MLKTEFTLRQYQTDFNRNLAIAVKQHRRVIGCAATGAGKSKTFLTIATNAVKKGLTVLVITESRKIYSQLIAEVHAFEIKAGSKGSAIIPNKIYLAMSQTLRRRQKIIDQFKLLGENLLIINDECHINEATNVLLQLPQALLIGFSGSPVGKHLSKLYHHLVVGPQPHELVLDGFLSPYRHFERKRADISQLEKDSIGEYTEESQERVFATREVFDGLLDDLRKIDFKKAIIYTSSIKHCEEVADMLRANGFPCVAIHSKVDQYAKEKGLFNSVKQKQNQSLEEAYMDQFMNGLIPICVNVFILGKGFDYPPTDLIGLLIKTSSLARYLQAIGRGSRVLKQDEGKEIQFRIKKGFTVIDYGQNCDGRGGHLPWDFERNWHALWKSKPKRAGVSPIKTCPRCEMVNKASAKVCINCGYIWSSESIVEPERPRESILVEVTEKYNKLVDRNLSDLSPEELSIYAKCKGKKGFAQIICKKHAIEGDREFIKEYGRHMGYKPYWAKFQLDSIDEMNEDQLKRFDYKDVKLK